MTCLGKLYGDESVDVFGSFRTMDFEESHFKILRFAQNDLSGEEEGGIQL
jgi:hypothetical protein